MAAPPFPSGAIPETVEDDSVKPRLESLFLPQRVAMCQGAQNGFLIKVIAVEPVAGKLAAETFRLRVHRFEKSPELLTV